MMKLSNGTIVHFRQPGLKEGRTKNLIRYYRHVGVLGSGQRTVYRATPLRKVVSSAKKAEETEKTEKTEKRKRTATDDSVVSVAKDEPEAKNAVSIVEVGSNSIALPDKVESGDSVIPLSVVEVGSSSIALPAPVVKVESSDTAVPVEPKATTSRGAKGRFISKKKKRKTANTGGFGAPADSATISSSSPTITATTAIQPPHPTVVVPHPMPEKFENVPDEPDVAIKLDYMTAREHRKFVRVPAVDRLGKLGRSLIWEYSVPLRANLTVQLSVTGAVVELMMCGWLEILQPAEPIWMVGLFLGLMMPIYEDTYPIFCREPIVIIQKGLKSLLKFHALGYVHCDLKWGNMLGKRKGGTYEVVLSDIEGAKRLGSACDGDMIATWEYMPLSMVAGFMSMQGGVPADVVSATPSVFDPDIDFWAFGVMILEHFCKTYTQNRFRVRDLAHEVDEQVNFGTPELVQATLKDLKKTFCNVYDERAYEPELRGAAAPGTGGTLCRLLRFLLRRVSGEELLLAEQRTHQQALDMLASLLPGLNITEAEASGSTARPSGVDHERDDQVRCPVLLPWGDCMVIKHAGGMVVKVPGKYEGTNHTFDICPTNHAIGYPRMKHRFFCANCPEGASNWGLIWNHSEYCLPEGTSRDKLEEDR